MRTPMRDQSSYPLKNLRARGVALPVMMIMLTVMLISSIYLLRSSLSSTFLTSNLAYDAALTKAADLGLLTGFQWLKDTAMANKALLDDDSAGNAYVATFDTTQSTSSPEFWVGSITLVQDGNRIEYVIHRMCALKGAYDKPSNSCMQTAPNLSSLGNAVPLGASLASDSTTLAGAPQVHYIVTARIFGARGSHVVNQAVVLIGA
jgi:Tfp pilus assembly protein PilX